MDLDEVLAATFSLVAPHLTERQRRLLFGAAARPPGYGGISRAARLAAVSRSTVRRGAAELDRPSQPAWAHPRAQRPQAAARARRLGLLVAWTGWSTLTPAVTPEPAAVDLQVHPGVAGALTAAGHPFSDDTVGRLLKQRGYRLQRMVKTLEGCPAGRSGRPVSVSQ